jgi:hypothetical protein
MGMRKNESELQRININLGNTVGNSFAGCEMLIQYRSHLLLVSWVRIQGDELKYMKISLVLVGAIVSTVFLGGCSQLLSAAEGCAPPSPKSNALRAMELAKTVEDIECISLEEFAVLNCPVIDALPSELLEDALSNIETLKKVTVPKEASQIVKAGLPGSGRTGYYEARDAVLEDLRVKARTYNYRPSEMQFWRDSFEGALTANCEQGPRFAETLGAISAFEKEKSRVSKLASSSWAPEGFSIDEKSGVAYKKLEGRGCSWGYCLHFEMVPKTFCAELKAGLFIDSKLNFIDLAGAVNVDKGERIRIQLNTEYDLSKVGHEVVFSCS